MRLTPPLALAALLLFGALVAPQPTAAQEATPIEVAYLLATGPFRERFGVYQEQLAAYQQIAAEDKHEGVAVTDLGNLTRELFMARQAFVEAVPSARLDQYDRTIELALERAYTAAVLLLRAQVTESEVDRAALTREAALQASSSRRLLNDADIELRAVLPESVPPVLSDTPQPR